MGVLDLKLLRDLRRLWPQALAIALVMAAGVATLVLGTGAVASLDRSRAAYYADNAFADLFASVTRAPRTVLGDVAAVPGVLRAEGRIVTLARLSMPGMSEPGSLLLVSAPDPVAGLNRLHLRQGRMPEPDRADEAVISDAFARAHGLGPGATLDVVIAGQRRTLSVTGVAISPEFIYALGPGDVMPDPRRFGIAWMPDAALAASLDLDGAFNDLVVEAADGPTEAIADRIDRILVPYGGTGMRDRTQQMSHAFLDAELTQLRGMSRVLPPIFLLVAAFLVNMTLSRLITLEREQIGLLKALGYGAGAIVRHYVGFVVAIAAVGIVLGWGVGAWLGAGLAGLYARFFDFPHLVFSRSPQPYAVAALVTVGAAVAGAVAAVRRVAFLPPAVAMSPPAPPRYRRLWGGAAERMARARTTTVMIGRHLGHAPWRTASSVMGVALAVAVLVGSLWAVASIEKMIDLSFGRTHASDATLVFNGALPRAAVFEVARLPGVLHAEPLRFVDVRLSHGHRARRITLEGRAPDGRLATLLDPAERPMDPPDSGVVLSATLARLLDVAPGDRVRIERLSGDRRSLEVPVAGLSLGTLGLTATTSLAALERMFGEPPLASGARVQLDPSREQAFHDAVKAAPETGVLMLKSLTVRRFRETMAENITTQITVYLALAGIIAFGVIYNFARISLSEQGRELASLRVIGFHTGEVAAILWGEIAAVVLIAQPVGWLIGTGFAVLVVQAFNSELYQVPLVLGREVYAWASLVVIGAALLSAALVRGRIARLDMIEVLKTRE